MPAGATSQHSLPAAAFSLSLEESATAQGLT